MPTILTYHHIQEPPAGRENPGLFVPPAAFERQLDWLKHSGTPVLSLDALRESLNRDGTAGRQRAAVITFDDGYENNWRHALPLLRRHGFTATFFVTTGWIGEKSPQGHAVMNEDQLRELADSGMTVGSHTVSHPWLARIPLHEARRELEESKARLEAITGAAVRWLCYPSGSFNPAIEDIARELGYAGACSVIRDNRMHARQMYHLPRAMVMHDTSIPRFRYLFTGLYHLLHARKNRKRWGPYL